MQHVVESRVTHTIMSMAMNIIHTPVVATIIVMRDTLMTICRMTIQYIAMAQLINRNTITVTHMARVSPSRRSRPRRLDSWWRW